MILNIEYSIGNMYYRVICVNGVKGKSPGQYIPVVICVRDGTAMGAVSVESIEPSPGNIGDSIYEFRYTKISLSGNPPRMNIH